MCGLSFDTSLRGADEAGGARNISTISTRIPGKPKIAYGLEPSAQGERIRYPPHSIYYS